jgi:hypothetical protein
MTDTRYNNGKIYKLVSNHTDKIYIGSTIQKLSSRISGHRRAYNTYLNGKTNNVTSFNLVCFPDCKIYLIELCNCNSKYELEKRERFYIESMECVNKIIPGRTKKEYAQDNHAYISERGKKYYQINKKKITDREKEKRKEKIECSICKLVLNKVGIKAHQKTKKCLSCVQ